MKVITGGIKANFPARIAFRVMQMIDSRTIIDQPGATSLSAGATCSSRRTGELIRIQCALVETREVERIVDFIGRQQGYSEAYRLPDYVPESSGGESSSLGSESGAPVRYDTLFADIARAAVSQGQISTSSIQRNYEVGFNRAGRIMMQLERPASSAVRREPSRAIFSSTTCLRWRPAYRSWEYFDAMIAPDEA